MQPSLFIRNISSLLYVFGFFLVFFVVVFFFFFKESYILWKSKQYIILLPQGLLHEKPVEISLLFSHIV